MKTTDIYTDEVSDFIDEEVRWTFGDAEEIGTSDVSCTVHTIMRQLNIHPDLFYEIQIMVRQSIFNLKSNY